ncbi:MAG: NAD(P)-dependent oxidoreductase [Methylobacter sp.]|uniref:NAD(P)-dependent oxidoreductase n=1 Tax=Methylobacter sp. TaxID=2051955 RepID=UPI00258EF7E8|nr:NAD(P)-dependent oxidoreductase [Methylobacter sp.]MCL7422073.1 NAD(P)-dependent oxidoreductase [Methylobacter sp.]
MATTKPAIAWLGAGLMGNPMAGRLLDEGYPVRVWNRTRAKAEALSSQGATVADSPADAVTGSDIVFTMLSDAQAVETALADVALSGKTLVQMSTIGPGENRRLAGQVNDAGGVYLEAPVLGSIPEARSGKLIIMAGGPEAAFAEVRPMLTCLGPEPRLIGSLGQASALKLALNQLIASLTVAFSTSLGFVEENGVDVDSFMEILRQSALYAPTFDKKLAKMQEHDYRNPNFPTEHLIKDIDLFKREARGLDTTMLDVLLQLYRRAQAGHGREDYSCVYDAVTGRC